MKFTCQRRSLVSATSPARPESSQRHPLLAPPAATDPGTVSLSGAEKQTSGAGNRGRQCLHNPRPTGSGVVWNEDNDFQRSFHGLFIAYYCIILYYIILIICYLFIITCDRVHSCFNRSSYFLGATNTCSHSFLSGNTSTSKVAWETTTALPFFYLIFLHLPAHLPSQRLYPQPMVVVGLRPEERERLRPRLPVSSDTDTDTDEDS